MIDSWGLRRRLGFSFILLGGLVASGLLLGLIGLSRLGAARHVVVDRLAPARAASDSYLQLALDQETGVRGYLLTRQPDFLTPYRRAQVQLPDAATATRDSLVGQPRLVSSFSREQDALRVWQGQYARPAVSAVAAGRPGAAPSAERGKQAFDALRASATTFSRLIDDELTRASDRLRTLTQLLLALGVSAVLLFIVVGAVTWRQLRRSILEPLEQLRSDARAVASGDLQHELQSGGPTEVRVLAADVETMRRRVVDEYAAATAAREDAERQRRLIADQATELRRSNADLEQFAYVASHDLQEPLRKVASFCQLLARRYSGQLDERADTYIGFAVDGARRMQLLIDDLLAFSRVGRADRPLQVVALDDCLRRAREDLSGRLRDSGATVVSDPLPTLIGDPGLLTQLFANLIGNAVKFRGEAPPIIRFRASRTAQGWDLSCTDNGIGIAPEHAERVFALFQRLHARDEYEGTGIGLSLCRRIVEFHGGRLWVDTGPRTGCEAGSLEVESLEVRSLEVESLEVRRGDAAGGTTLRWTLPDRRAAEQLPPADAAASPAA